MKEEFKKVGIVIMPIISNGGGFQKLARDLIATLNSLGKEVHIMTPFKLDMKKIEELYGKIEVAKTYYPENKYVNFLGREDTLGRKLMIKQFKKMAKKVDVILDLDGRVFHNHLPKEFNKKNYIVWRISCINPETHKIQNFTNWKILVKKIAKKILWRRNDLPTREKIYPVDEWTREEIKKFWKINTKEICVYPEIQVEKFDSSRKKEKQIVILSRIAPNKDILKSIEIFYKGTKKFQGYRLLIMGGSTPDTEEYMKKIKNLIKELGIKKRVKIRTDVSFEEIKEGLEKSEIIIDSQIGTSMNMPVIEAMAAGCISLMRKYSGTFTEILENGKYGYGFESVEEGAKILENIISQKKKDYKKSVGRAQYFSSSMFKKRLMQMLEN